MPILFLIAAAGRAHRAARPLTAFRSARASVLLVLLGVAATGAHADICKYIDQEGNVHYTNVAPEKGWKRQGCSVGDDGTPRSPSPAGSGTAPRNAFDGPSQFSMNASVLRTFRISERMSLDWRLDATNVLNRVTYASVNTLINSAQFGRSTQTFDAREIQFGLKFIF